ncbi:MAG: hypothetical protein WC498_03725 [Candidatus Saccharimonadales bacterium]
MNARYHGFINKCFRDPSGRIVVAQAPNMPLWVFIATSVAAHFVQSTGWRDGLRITATIALIIWSLLEIFQGVNYFRRALGLVVLSLCAASIVQMLR